MSALSFGEQQRGWLRRFATGSGASLERDYLPDLPSGAWVQAVGGGVDGSVGPAEFATVLLAVARDGDTSMRAKVVDALAGAEVRWWLAMDEALRERWSWAPVWSRRLARDLADGEVDMLRLVVAACHHNGRVREAAVALLAGQPHPAAAIVLALRTADWVAEVRDVARAALDARLAMGEAAVAGVADTAFALRGRREGAWLAGRIEWSLRQLPAESLLPMLAARDRRTRRAAYGAAIGIGLLELEQLTAAAVLDDDLPIRTMCARAAVQTAVAPAQLRGLLASRTALVRAEALHALTMDGDVDAAAAALPDRHPLVRAVAQAALRRTGSDPAEHYRRLVEHEPAEPGAIAGLGETGVPDDADVVARWLSHPRARGRVEAIRALRRLGAIRPTELVPLLRDQSAAVTRQAVTTLRREIGGVHPTVLEALLSSGNAPHVRLAGYRLLIAGDAWQRLAVNLRLVDDPDERLRVASRADITVWLDQEAATTYHAPSGARAAELDSLIGRASPMLGERKVRLLRFHAGLEAPR